MATEGNCCAQDDRMLVFILGSASCFPSRSCVADLYHFKLKEDMHVYRVLPLGKLVLALVLAHARLRSFS
jgi:hypothetical protein